MSIYSKNEYHVKTSMSNTKRILAFQRVRLDMNKQLRTKQQKYHLSHKNKLLQELRVRTECSFKLYSGIPIFYNELGSKVSVHMEKVSLVKTALDNSLGNHC